MIRQPKERWLLVMQHPAKSLIFTSWFQDERLVEEINPKYTECSWLIVVRQEICRGDELWRRCRSRGRIWWRVLLQCRPLPVCTTCPLSQVRTLLSQTWTSRDLPGPSRSCKYVGWKHYWQEECIQVGCVLPAFLIWRGLPWPETRLWTETFILDRDPLDRDTPLEGIWNQVAGQEVAYP